MPPMTEPEKYFKSKFIYTHTFVQKTFWRILWSDDEQQLFGSILHCILHCTDTALTSRLKYNICSMSISNHFVFSQEISPLGFNHPYAWWLFWDSPDIWKASPNILQLSRSTILEMERWFLTATVMLSLFHRLRRPSRYCGDPNPQ